MDAAPIPERARGPRSILAAISLTFLGQGTILVLATVSSILSARLLGPGGKGQLNTAIVAAGMLGLLAEMGLRTAAIRTVAAGRLTWKEAVATLVTMYAVLCAVVLPLASVFLWHFQNVIFRGIPIEVLFLALAIFPIGLAEGSLTSALAGHQRVPEASAVQIADRLATISGFVLLVWAFGLGLVGATVSQLVGPALGVLVALVMLYRLPGGRLRVRTDLVPEFVRFGWVYYIANLAMSLNYRLDALIVFALLGRNGAGLYAVAVAVAEMPLHLPNSIALVLFPRVSGDSRAAELRTARLSRSIVFVVAVACFGLAVLGHPLLRVMFGHRFVPAYPAMALLLPGMILLGQTKVLSADVIGRGYPRYSAMAAWIALIATVALDLLLIPRWGIIGAAVASSVAYSISDCAMVASYRRLTGVGLRSLYITTLAELAEVAGRLGNLIRRTPQQ